MHQSVRDHQGIGNLLIVGFGLECSSFPVTNILSWLEKGKYTLVKPISGFSSAVKFLVFVNNDMKSAATRKSLLTNYLFFKYHVN